MRHRRRFVPSASTRYPRALEALEQRLVMSSTYVVSPIDLPLSATLPTPSGYSPVVSEPIAGETYTLRQLVYYYDNYYNSTSEFVVDLNSQTYTLNAPGRNENLAMTGDLDVYLGGSFGSIGSLVIQNGTIDGSFLDRVFQVYQGASLQLSNVIVQNGFATDDGGSDAVSDALGGGILVGSGGTPGTLLLSGCTITNNYATGAIGYSVGTMGSGLNRQGAGFNAAGGGLYGGAGSSISIDSASRVLSNAVTAGKGAVVNDPSVKQGGAGGSGYGGGIAINAPASGPSSAGSLPSAMLSIAGGAQINQNRINQTITSNMGFSTRGGTGGSCNSGPGGTGGNAYGAGLYMGSGQLNLSANNTFVQLNNNTAAAGPGFYRTSTANAGTAGAALGAGTYLMPSQVLVSGTSEAGGILQYSGNTTLSVAGYTTNPYGVTRTSGSSGNTMASVAPNAVDPGSTTSSSPWTLRTAVAAASALSSTGMDVRLNLEAGTMSLGGGTGTNSGSLVIADNLATGGLVKIVGNGSSSTFISAVPVSGNSGPLTASIFAFNGAKVILKDVTITGGAATGNGGAISTINSDVTITSATLSQNSSPNGGGIYQSQGTLTLNNARITSNTATGSGAGSGGGLFLDDGSTTSFLNGTQVNGNTAAGLGGGFYAYFSTVTVDSSTISGNTAASGGGIFESGQTLTLSNVNITGNSSSTGYGGGLLVNAGNVLTMTGGAVTGNKSTASNGGGIGVSGASVNILSGNISGNTATGPGGAGGGLFQSGGTVRLQSTPVVGNSATQGGGIFVSGGNLSLTTNVVNKNTLVGPGNGAGICAAGNPVLNLITVNLVSNLTSGSASGGGGIYQSSGSLTFKNFKINNNRAVYGAGMYLTGVTSTIKGGEVVGNVATSYGGGVFSSGNSLNLENVNVLTNSVQPGSGGSGYGGGVYQGSGGTLTLSGTTAIVNNSASYGGGVVVNGGGLAANGTSINQNSATVFGGGLFINAPVNAMALTGVAVVSNRINAPGTGSGGGIYLSGGTLNTNGLTLQNNSIQASSSQLISGAGIYAVGSTLNLTNGSTITGNSLVGNGSGSAYGAGLWIGSTPLNVVDAFNVQNNSITNVVTGVGGGIAFFTNSAFAMNGALNISSNNAVSGGNELAFAVSSTSDNTNNSSASGFGGIATFTSSTSNASLRDAITYAQNYMMTYGASSMAIMLPTTSSSYYLSTQTALSPAVSSGYTLSIVGTSGYATIQGNNSQVFYINNASNGTLALQNVNITGGYAKGQYAASGGGISQVGGIVQLNAVSIYGNIAQGTQVGATGAGGGFGQTGATGGPGASAFGGGYYLGSATLYVTSSVSITGNTVIGANGGTGGNGGGGGANADGAYCNNTTNAGNGGAGGPGGDALGGGIFQAVGAVLNKPSGWVVSGNTATPGKGGSGGSGGSGSPGSDQCKYAGGSTGATGSTGSYDANYCYGSGSHVYSTNGGVVATFGLGGGMPMSAGTLSVKSLAMSQESASPQSAVGITISLYSADGTLIATTQTDASGNYRFHTNFSGLGYIQVTPVPTFDVVPRGVRGRDGRISSIDPVTMRSEIVDFLAGVPVGRHLDVLLNPVETTLITGRHGIRLVRADNGKLLWSTQVKGKNYRGGYSVSMVDFNFDRTQDYVLIPRSGKATPIFIEGRFGTVTHVQRAVNANLRKGFEARSFNVTGASTPSQWILSRSRFRSGRVSLVDLATKRTLWTTRESLFGKSTIDTVMASAREGASPAIELRSVLMRRKHFQKAFDASTGRMIQQDQHSVKTGATSHHD